MGIPFFFKMIEIKRKNEIYVNKKQINTHQTPTLMTNWKTEIKFDRQRVNFLFIVKVEMFMSIMSPLIIMSSMVQNQVQDKVLTKNKSQSIKGQIIMMKNSSKRKLSML